MLRIFSQFQVSSNYCVASSKLLFLHQTINPSHPTKSYSNRTISMSSSEENSGDQREEIVIVGGGIAGLATALALHRDGIRSRVLEQSASLRTEGASLSLFKNGWKMLDLLGVGNQLRSQFLEIQRMTMKALEGKELGSFDIKRGDPSQEVRAVERSILLKTLADELPPNTIQFSSKLANIAQDGATGETKLHLTNGSRISAKIVIGCDGIHSPLAKWMGFSETKYSGHCCFRGLAFYPNGHSFAQNAVQICSKGKRSGFAPITPTKVYWFLIYNSPTPGPIVTDPSELKTQATTLAKDWPSDMLELINRTMDDTISVTPFQDRWLWPFFSPPVHKGKMVLVGDAWHPMTPNLGQGGCCALEDAVVLANKLSKAMKFKQGSIEDALQAYGDERQAQLFSLTVKSNFTGAIMQSNNSIVCYIRDAYIIPKLVKKGPVLEHTNFSGDLDK